MPELYLLAATMVSSVAGYAVMKGLVTVSAATLRLALWRTIECVGISLIFLAANVATELVLVLLVREVTGRFVSLYFAGELMIVPISCLQGLAACWWKQLSRP